MAGKGVPIGVELVKRGLIDEADIKTVIEFQKEHPDKRIGEIIHHLNLCDEQKLLQAMGEILEEKVILLDESLIDINIQEYASIDVLRQVKAVPFAIVGGKIRVCFCDFANKRAIEQVRLLFMNKGLVMERYLTFEPNIMRILNNLGGKSSENINSSGGDITTLVDTIMKSAMAKNASDIHVEPQETTVRIRFRIDGELVTVANIDKERLPQLVGRFKAISNMHQEKQESQDGRINIYPDYNIRVSSQKNVNGEKFCLRLLKKNAGIKKIFDLGFPNDENILRQCFDKKNSITVVAAPTGEGKTTTLYSIIDYLNKPEINVTTIEDPVEIRISGLNQVEIDSKTSFADSLRTILRQDPDIILLGEIRDKETAEIALQSGQTGHYVLSTIHTIDAVEVLTRLRKMGISDYDIASTLATAVSQRLIRKPCKHCATQREFKPEEIEMIKKLGAKYGEEFDFKDKLTWEPNGCKECNYTGFSGRIACFEILAITETLKPLIADGESSLKVRDAAIKEGYRPLYIDALKKVVNGDITLDEVNKKLILF